MKEPIPEVCYCGHPKTSHDDKPEMKGAGYVFPADTSCFNCACRKFIRRENERNEKPRLYGILDGYQEPAFGSPQPEDSTKAETPCRVSCRCA